MESFLANRPKMPGMDGLDSLDPAEGLAFGDISAGGTDSFMAGLPRTGGFQSLKTALLEAGSVVDPQEVERAAKMKEHRGQPNHLPHAIEGHDAHPHQAEPTVELIKNNGRIEKVIVTCSCSKKIELDCVY